MFAPSEEAARFNAVKSRVRMTRYGGDCYGYCLLAAGFVDLIVEAGLKPYDIVALVPIIEAAGGRRHDLGRRARRPTAAASSPPATAACTRRRWRSCAAGASGIAEPAGPLSPGYNFRSSFAFSDVHRRRSASISNQRKTGTEWRKATP